MAYTIKEVSKITGISPHTLRFWARNGIFPHIERDKNGVKYFSKSDVDSVLWVDCLRKMEMSVEDIKHYQSLFSRGLDSINERKKMLESCQVKVEAKLKELLESSQKLKKQLAIYEMIEKSGENLFDPANPHHSKAKEFFLSKDKNARLKL